MFLATWINEFICCLLLHTKRKKEKKCSWRSHKDEKIKQEMALVSKRISFNSFKKKKLLSLKMKALLPAGCWDVWHKWGTCQELYITARIPNNHVSYSNIGYISMISMAIISYRYFLVQQLNIIRCTHMEEYLLDLLSKLTSIFPCHN